MPAVLFHFFAKQPNYQSQQTLLALSTLMARACQQLAMFVLAHFFSALFYNAAQSITSLQKIVRPSS